MSIFGDDRSSYAVARRRGGSYGSGGSGREVVPWDRPYGSRYGGGSWRGEVAMPHRADHPNVAVECDSASGECFSDPSVFSAPLREVGRAPMGQSARDLTKAGARALRDCEDDFCAVSLSRTYPGTAQYDEGYGWQMRMASGNFPSRGNGGGSAPPATDGRYGRYSGGDYRASRYGYGRGGYYR